MAQLYTAGIIGIGSFIPENVVTNKDIEKLVDTTDEWIVTRTGIRERRIIDKDMATSDMATIAAKRALEDADIEENDIDLIIVATATPDMRFPSTACLVQENLKAVNAAAFDINAACSGFLYALTVGEQFIVSGLYKYVLVIGADCLSRFVDWKDRKTCILFGDGAGAVVLSPVEKGYGILSKYLGADGSGSKFLSLGGGSRQQSGVENNEESYGIYMDGSEVFKFAVRAMSSAAEEAAKLAGITSDKIDYFIPHQSNIRIIDSVVKRLNIDTEKVLVNLERYGNTSAASIPIALDEAVKNDKIKKGDNLCLAAFGGGFTWGSCVINWAK